MLSRALLIATLACSASAATPARPSLRARRADEPCVKSFDGAAKALEVVPPADLHASVPSASSPLVVLSAAAALFFGATMTPTGQAAVSAVTGNAVLRKAAKKALGGGLSGMVAGVIQVLCLMWLRTAMNYQYRYGTSTGEALRTLYAQGGIGRFYQGVGWALLQTPLSRFGDTAANTGVLELLAAVEVGKKMPVGVRTACASAAGSMWRIGITPLDTLKTTLQVEGPAASALLAAKVKSDGFGVLYNGALANALASFVGSYPWFFTFNFMNELLPQPPAGVLLPKLLRSAMLGVTATCVSDTIANSLRVVKTTRQTSAQSLSYTDAIGEVVKKDGYVGLFTRGLGTRLLTNCIQASMFTIVWKLMEEKIAA